MKIIYFCWSCGKAHTEEDNKELGKAGAKGIKCECGGYIISPSGKMMGNIIW